VNRPKAGPSKRGTLVAFATIVGLALLGGSWIGHFSREESWEQHLYTMFFVKVAAGAFILLGVVFLFLRRRRALSVAFFAAAASFWLAFHSFSSDRPREAPMRSSAFDRGRSAELRPDLPLSGDGIG
jgi:hypothetical protein